MREFKVLCEDMTHRYGIIANDKAYTLLSGPEVKRAIEHLLFPEVGQHKGNKDKLCKVCKDE